MRFKHIYTTLILAALLACTFTFTSCDDDRDPIIEELDLARVLGPADMRAFIRNRTSIELNWVLRDGVEEYEVEFSEDSLEFTSIILSITVTPDEVPITRKFFGDTRYSARVRAVSPDSRGNSSWSAITIETESENIFAPIENADVAIDGVTVKWLAGEEATRFVINPGAVERPITAGEVAAGEANITGLDDFTDYTITMYRNNSQRGFAEFRTLLDGNCATCVKLSPGADINAAVASAADGSIIVLAAGTYADQGTIDISKNITIQGEVYYDQPVVYGQLACATTVTTLKTISVTWRGDASSTLSQFFNTQSGCNLTTFLIQDCDISNYSNNFVYNNASGTFGDIIITENYVHDIVGGGGDGIDFRGGTIVSLTVENNTFAFGFRTFLRMQAACNAAFRNNTFYRVANNDSGNNHGLFRMSGGGMFEVSNCLFVETGVPGINDIANSRGNFCRQASNMVETPSYSGNNIYGCHNIFGGLYNAASLVSAVELDPQFADGPNGDFTITNQAVLDLGVGDPRWR